MKVGQIAKPALFTERDGTKDYKILFLKTVTDAHKASLEKDFPKIKERAYAAKMDRVISEWFERKRKQTYIRIDKNAECGLLKGWSTDTTAQAN
jgi:peptidyl-prolyl cis-trans isomerase SurA